jgi:hypothetical protein
MGFSNLLIPNLVVAIAAVKQFISSELFNNLLALTYSTPCVMLALKRSIAVYRM